MTNEKVKLSDKMVKTIENWLNAGYSVSSYNLEPNEHGIVYTVFDIDLDNGEYPIKPSEYSSYYYNYLNGISHKESYSPKAWEDTLKLIVR